MRKLASIRHIGTIEPIEQADRIEVATVDGWRVVVGKNQFKPGQKIVFFETDSLLPTSNLAFESFAKRGTVDFAGIQGHVLRTVKLKGVYSQGLIMGLEELGLDPDMAPGTDVSQQLGVVKYEAPVAVGSKIIGSFDSAFAPKTDAPRLQNLAGYWEEIQQLAWIPSVKVDGASHTLVRDRDNQLKLFTRNRQIVLDGPEYEAISETGIPESLVCGQAVQFELCGPKIQSNRLKLKRLTPFVFAVWFNHQPVEWSDWPKAARQASVPQLDPEQWRPEGSIEEMIEKVDGIRGYVTKDILDEGVVWKLASGQRLPSWLEENLNFKIINNKYLLKHKL